MIPQPPDPAPLLKTLQAHLRTSPTLQVTVWNPLDETVEYTFPASIAETAGTLVRLSPEPGFFSADVPPLLQRDAIVGIFLEACPTPFLFYPKVQIPPAEKTGCFWIRLNEDMSIEPLRIRRHVRIPLVTPFEVALRQAGGTGEGEPQYLPAQTVDISGGGLKFTSPAPFQSEQALSLRLKLDTKEPPLLLKAVVILCEEKHLPQQPSEWRYVVACRFVDPTPVQERLIMKECFRRELSLKNRL
jgi:hypothetical protein